MRQVVVVQTIEAKFHNLGSISAPEVLIEGWIHAVWTWWFVRVHKENSRTNFIYLKKGRERRILFWCHFRRDVFKKKLLVTVFFNWKRMEKNCKICGSNPEFQSIHTPLLFKTLDKKFVRAFSCGSCMKVLKICVSLPKPKIVCSLFSVNLLSM